MARILVFDSGVGGLSILRALQKNDALKKEQHEWLFCSDNAFFPYGIKKENDLIARVTKVLTALENQYQPDIIVLACNTASTVALESVRSKLKAQVVGVVPAIKPAALLTASHCIGLLATPGTINRAYTQKLIDDFASNCNVIRVGSNELVWVAEQYLRTGMVDHSELHKILTPLRNAIAQHQLDTVVLACTHFPLLIDFLQEQLPEVKHWVDSSDAIARRVVWCLEQRENLTQESSPPASGLAIFTRVDPNTNAIRKALEYLGLTEIRALDLPD